MASASSCASFAFTESVIERFLRSTFIIFASISSPSLTTVVASSTRSSDNSLARIVPVISSANATVTVFGSTAVTVPLTIAPLVYSSTKLAKLSPSSCLIPKEIRSRSGSIARITASISCPFCIVLLLLHQELSKKYQINELSHRYLHLNQ